MTQIDIATQSVDYLNAANASTVGQASQTANEFLVNPWIGIAFLCALVVSGAAVVIREILIEDKEDDIAGS